MLFFQNLPYSLGKVMANVLPYIQIVLSVILIISILLQQSGAGLGGALGGGDGGPIYHTKRGFEKFLFYFSITVAIFFAASSTLAVIL